MNIKGGYILLARKTLESEIMHKPPLYFKLWGWMLLQAKFSTSKNEKRGSFKTSISAMQDAMSYHVGYRKQRPSVKQIRGIYESLTKGSMIGTMKVTDGLMITISNYNEYQEPKNYEGHNEGVHEGKSRGTTYNNKKDKNELYTGKSALDFFEHEMNGWDLKEVEKAFDGFIFLRKLKKISDGVLEKEIEYWNKYPCEIINRALIIYNSSKFWEQLKGEKYLRGIIRGKMKESEKHNSQSLLKKAF